MHPFKLCAFADEASPMIDAQIAAMKRNGVIALEMRQVDGENVSAISMEKAAEVRKKLDDAGLIAWSLGSPLGKIDIETGDWAAEQDKLKHTIELAHVLGAENIRMFSFYMPKDGDPAAFRSKVMDRLIVMAQIARGTGVTLCHENEKGIYGDIPERCADIHQTVPEIAGVFDPANYIQCGQDTWHCWELMHPYLKYMHIKDALPEGMVVPAGAGAGQIARLLAAYRAQGGQWLTIEPHLKVFDGLAALEREGETSQVGAYVYETADAAFDAACEALKKLY